MAKKQKPVQITAKLAEQIANGEVQLIPSEVANQLTPAVMERILDEAKAYDQGVEAGKYQTAQAKQPKRRIVKPALIPEQQLETAHEAKRLGLTKADQIPAAKKSKSKSSPRNRNLIDALGLPRLEKRTKVAMLKRAEEIERMIKKGDVPKNLIQRATERAAFYRQQGE